MTSRSLDAHKSWSTTCRNNEENKIASVCRHLATSLRKLHQSLGGEKPCIAVENLQATISRESVSRNKR